MCIPVRCFTCNKIIALVPVLELIEKARTRQHFQKIFKKFGFKRSCCRRIILTSVPVLETLKK